MAGSNSPNAFDSGTARRPRKGTGLKFWLTASLAAIGMTALMTFIVISNPANQKTVAPVLKVEKSASANAAKAPKLSFDRDAVTMDRVPQFYKGDCEFKLKNEGESTLTLVIDHKSCTCLDPSLGKPELQPGESTVLKFNFDTKESIGVKPVKATIRTNDPIKPVQDFRVDLNIIRELMIEPAEVELGAITKSDKFEKVVYFYSLHNTDLKITEPKMSAQGIDLKVEPMSPAELKDKAAKIGYKLKLSSSGLLPIGMLLERITVKTGLSRMPEASVLVRAAVSGDITIEPVAIVQFGNISADEDKKFPLRVFNKASASGDTLSIASIEPSTIKINLNQDKSFKSLWRMDVIIPKGHEPGKINGKVVLNNKEGKPVLSIPVTALVVGK